MIYPNDGRADSFPGRARWFSLAALVFAAGCGDGGPAPLDGIANDPEASAERESGALSFSMTVPHGVRFETFHYVIVGPNYSRSGGIDVTNSSTVSTLVEGIPPGTDYAVTLMGTIAIPVSAECSGSESFVVNPGEVTRVSVSVPCHETDAVAPPPVRVPIPPLGPITLGFFLLAAGALVRGSAPSASRCRNIR